MTENVKIARLWYKFHRLTEGHKELIMEISEMLVRQADAFPEKDTVKELPVKADSKRRSLKKI
ncbi:MAG: hypothetical protein LBC57_10795 [Treponema sp.]|jgi:phenylpyruvate tautomerase PptA (4-oxalocrotonate tautomerase family)|nr:hypothetical protein [Treponema sp.]